MLSAPRPTLGFFDPTEMLAVVYAAFGFNAPAQTRATGRTVSVSMYNGGGNRKWAPSWQTQSDTTRPAAAAPATATAGAENVDCSSMTLGQCLQILVDKARAPLQPCSSLCLRIDQPHRPSGCVAASTCALPGLTTHHAALCPGY